MGDYIIGTSCLFFLATALLFTLIRGLEPRGRSAAAAFAAVSGKRVAPQTFLFRFVGFALLIVLGSATYVHALAEAWRIRWLPTDPNAVGRFPQRVGQFKLQSEWNEYLEAGGPLIFYWADYVYDGPGVWA